MFSQSRKARKNSLGALRESFVWSSCVTTGHDMLSAMARMLRYVPFLALAATAVLWPQTKVWTAQELFQRNVGTKQLAAFLVVTPEGNILINSTYERNVPVIRKSIEDLGFRFADTKIVLGSHAHADHMEGDALMKELTGAKVMAIAQDVPALERMTPGGKPHPIDRVLQDGDEVTVGGSTLVAHLTPGHTRGCTTWTMKVQEGGKTYNVLIIGSMGVNAGAKLVNNPQVADIAEEYKRGFRVLHGLACDIPLGSHPAMYNLAEKYSKLGKGPNPFIDPEGYKNEVNIEEGAFLAVLREQEAAGK